MRERLATYSRLSKALGSGSDDLLLFKSIGWAIIGRDHLDKTRHCETPQATKQSRPGAGTVAPRLLRYARYDSLCGIDGFMPCGSATLVAN
jgi:hypothetical protein